MPLPLWGLTAAHLALNLAVAYTDLRYRRVYLVWSLGALLVGLGTALVAPAPELHLGLGAILFGLGYYRWQRGQHGGTAFGGGDVFMFTYLGLTFGLTLLGPLVATFGVTTLALVSGRLKWTQSAPAAGLWALGALAWLLLALLLGVNPFTGGEWVLLLGVDLPPALA